MVAALREFSPLGRQCGEKCEALGMWRSTPRALRGAIEYVQSRYLLMGMESEVLPTFGQADGPDFAVWGRGMLMHIQVIIATTQSDGVYEAQLPGELEDIQLLAVMLPPKRHPDVICLNPYRGHQVKPNAKLMIQSPEVGKYQSGHVMWESADLIWEQWAAE